MDFLNDFDPSDDENEFINKQKTQNYPPFSPNLHEKFWFRDVSKENQPATAINEIDLFRVGDLFDAGNFEEAENILTELSENTKNNRTHEIMLIDSLLQCSIQKENISSTEASTCQQLLSDYESLLVDFGDQIQFLRTKAPLLSKFPPSEQLKNEFKSTVALLCQLCGSFENWQLFENGSQFLNDSEIYGLKMKMKKVLHYEIEHSKGFVKEKLERKLKKIEEEEKVLEEKLKKEQIELILSSLNIHREIAFPESATSAEFRAHDSRSKSKLIPKSDQSTAVSDFFKRFPFFSS
uniref:Uncharacterized protein n=2 Tax=Caenorhabditis tropicalis TaxID=1561998 RepID=A0A1I7U645_9PELO